MKVILFENEDLYILQDLGNAYIVGKSVLDEHIIDLSDRDLENRIADIISNSKKPIFYDEEWEKHFMKIVNDWTIEQTKSLIKAVLIDDELSDKEIDLLALNVIEHIENESEYYIAEREINQ